MFASGHGHERSNHPLRVDVGGRLGSGLAVARQPVQHKGMPDIRFFAMVTARGKLFVEMMQAAIGADPTEVENGVIV